MLMKLIQCLTDNIHEELADAHKYAMLALKYKETEPSIAKVFASLSQGEMEHMELLHDTVADVIADYRKNTGEPPADMMAIYNYLHEKEIEKAAEVKRLQGMYR